MSVEIESHNFQFLAAYDAQFVRLATLAERYFRDDPNTCLIKLRQFGELLAQEVAARVGLFASADEPQSDLLRRLKAERAVPPQAMDLFHQIRIAGNQATHAHAGDHAQALTTLKIARAAGGLVSQDLRQAARLQARSVCAAARARRCDGALREELERLRGGARRTPERRGARPCGGAKPHARARESAEEQARREAEERRLGAARAGSRGREASPRRASSPPFRRQRRRRRRGRRPTRFGRAEEAAKAIDLDEAETRALIDQQLRDRGWEADTKTLRYASGARPAKGRNMAIAEWPTASGPADYALFVGTQLVGVVEAKRRRQERLGGHRSGRALLRRASSSTADFAMRIGGPWGEHQVPFVFAANGRPYLKQIETESGIWFRDTRRAANHRRALVDWPTPEGLSGCLRSIRMRRTPRSRPSPSSSASRCGLPARRHQGGRGGAWRRSGGPCWWRWRPAPARPSSPSRCSIACSTPSGSGASASSLTAPRLAIRPQASSRTTKIVSGKAFADIFGLKGLEDVDARDGNQGPHLHDPGAGEARAVSPPTPSEAPPVDQYDLMVVDECHRGYLLDREMSDAELSFRGQEDYISKYRRVLEYFDAVKIGLTATPALHTTDIFGDPIFTYSYREAVIDGYLIDHEPPIRIETALARAGIMFEKDEQLDLLNTQTGEIDLAHAPDEIRFEVEQFNKQVDHRPSSTGSSPRNWPSTSIPALPGKTLIFAATDAHADIVVERASRRPSPTQYGEIDDAAVKKITGSVDKVRNLIRSFRNDAIPKIAVTVDLLTTGIDVPSITNLVFLRRVNSRILYEQMIGRATRQCPEIGKEVFRIFDAVDLYPHLQNLTDMKPVVVNPSISFEQLVDELIAADQDDASRDDPRAARREAAPPAEEAARGGAGSGIEAVAGETPEATLKRLLEGQARRAGRVVVVAIRHRPDPRLAAATATTPRFMPISHHADEVVAVTRGYGEADKPEDFLDGFSAFVRDNINTIAALKLVVQRPRDLTRADLKELRMALDLKGYSEANLRRAWADAKNEDIAASIIGFVRQAALGDPLMPYGERVKAAMQRIMASRQWTDPQKRWLQAHRRADREGNRGGPRGDRPGAVRGGWRLHAAQQGV